MHLLPKLGPLDDVEVFLYMFKQMVHREGWPEEEWAQDRTPLLSNKAQHTYLSLPQHLPKTTAM